MKKYQLKDGTVVCGELFIHGDIVMIIHPVLGQIYLRMEDIVELPRENGLPFSYTDRDGDRLKVRYSVAHPDHLAVEVGHATDSARSSGVVLLPPDQAEQLAAAITATVQTKK